MNPRVLLAGVLLAVGAVALVLVTSGGGDLSPAKGLSWEQGHPTVLEPADLPRDRIAYGQVRNDGLEQIQVSVDDLDVRDAQERAVPHSARFIASFVHGLYGAFQQPDSMPDPEKERLGFLAKLNPGQVAPLTVAAHMPKGTKLPLRIFYKGRAVLDIPRKAKVAG